ncbi:hypothetical protein SLS60_007200 [Paraconiothyrium brasiliense]|uniref:Major royal jelly protein n=1 Tax=Paraconiothyrium brasiliense TaxID=300254 RepID=A0ABR3R8X1_9PLEO
MSRSATCIGKLELALELETPCTAVSTTPEGRTFLVYTRIDMSKGPSCVEYKNGTNVAYPNADAYYSEGKDPATHLLRVNTQRIGPDGSLWLVDVGSPDLGGLPIMPTGPKLVQVNLTTDSITRIYSMGNATLQSSYLDDVRFNPASGKAYLTDVGSAAIIILDLASGHAIRVLENDTSTLAHSPKSADGHLIRNMDGTLQYTPSDQLEVSPDGKWFYYQPASGAMSRIQTAYLDAAFYNSSMASSLPQLVEFYALTPGTGGTAIDAEGNIYLGDVDRRLIEKIYPNGTRTVLIQDERLSYVDAMWVDSRKKLWIPAAQLHLAAAFNNGTDRIRKPIEVFTLDIGVGPSPVDHV